MRTAEKLLILMSLFCAVPSWGANGATARPDEFQLHSKLVTAAEPLTTEKAWELDPSELNPHHRFWAIKKVVSLQSVSTFQYASATSPVPKTQIPAEPKFGVKAKGLFSDATLYVRDAGPWFQKFTTFDCRPEPNSWFSTQEGSGKAGLSGAKHWDRLLDRDKGKLYNRLQQIRATTAEHAVQMAQLIFDDWLAGVNAEWNTHGRSSARSDEWRFYTQQAAQQKLCKNGPKPRGPTPRWAQFMETVPSETSLNLLTRAPGRLWNGLISSRMAVEAGDQTLNGQFLIDSGTALSTVSPGWLEGQGINPLFVRVKNGRPHRVVWSAGGGGSGVAFPAEVIQARFANHPIPLRRFLLIDTDFYSPPEFEDVCCDGILGIDFLRSFVVEVDATNPGPGVRLWTPEGFNPGRDYFWQEMSASWSDGLLSSCKIVSSAIGSGGKGIFKPVSVTTDLRWDSGSELGLELPASMKEHFKGGHVGIQCGNEWVARELTPRWVSGIQKANLGMAVLGKRPIIFDLPHGKIWFKTLEWKPVLKKAEIPKK